MGAKRFRICTSISLAVGGCNGRQAKKLQIPGTHIQRVLKRQARQLATSLANLDILHRFWTAVSALPSAVTMQLGQTRLLDFLAQELRRSPLTDRYRICSQISAFDHNN
jgi:hypothetical protein